MAITRKASPVGKSFGRLTVMKSAGRSRDGRDLWLCRCECGNRVTVRGNNLGRHTFSCGCMSRDKLVARSKLIQYYERYGGTQPSIHEGTLSGLRELQSLRAAPPGGFVVVPREPTPEMAFAGGLAIDGDQTTSRAAAIASYRAMLAAVEKPK